MFVFDLLYSARYRSQRYRLFSRFDDGVRLDEGISSGLHPCFVIQCAHFPFCHTFFCASTKVFLPFHSTAPLLLIQPIFLVLYLPESWYSVTPEAVAAYMAKVVSFSVSFAVLFNHILHIHTPQRIGGAFVVDAFCGSGGNVIQLALHGARGPCYCC